MKTLILGISVTSFLSGLMVAVISLAVTSCITTYKADSELLSIGGGTFEELEVMAKASCGGGIDITTVSKHVVENENVMFFKCN